MNMTKTTNLTFSEALRALLDGKTIANEYDNRIRLVGEKVYFAEGDPCEDMRACMFEDTDGPFSIVEPKNEETPGTFAWARRETELDRSVRRSSWYGIAVLSKTNFLHVRFSLADIDATDWTNA